jgi:hypothetical protein
MMATKNRFFDTESDEVHPTARVWLERIRSGQKATFTLWRKRDGLIFRPAKIYMTFETPSGKERDHDDWDVDINEALVREGVRAESDSNEAQRLSLMFRYWFSKPEERFGPGYFEGVLVQVLTSPEFSGQATVAATLAQIHVTPPLRGNNAYTDCENLIESIIKAAAASLTQDLRYPVSQAERILAEALAKYLDERFHITERRMLGFR